jgi:hypothetical protein
LATTNPKLEPKSILGNTDRKEKMKLLIRRKIISKKNIRIIKRKTEHQGISSIFSVGIVGRCV